MSHSNKTLPKLKIAIADDSSLNRMLWRTLFREWNPSIEIDEAKNGLELVDLVQNNRYDVVLTDVMMPTMDGIEATKYIREFNPFVPIIGISGSNQSYDLSTYESAGMSSYLSKPIEFSTLLKEISKLIQVDLLDTSANSEVSGVYSRVRKLSKNEEHFKELKKKLNDEISELIGRLETCEDQPGESHKLVNKFIYVNDPIMLELASDCEKLIKRELSFSEVLNQLSELWNSFLENS